MDEDEIRFDVEVWDLLDGDLVEKLWDATEEEADGIHDRYEDDPMKMISVTIK